LNTGLIAKEGIFEYLFDPKEGILEYLIKEVFLE